MKTKKLFVIITNSGDGSSNVQYTFNEEYINKLQDMYDNDAKEFDYEYLSDGDGFHYYVLTLPINCTMESLGIYSDFAKRGLC